MENPYPAAKNVLASIDEGAAARCLADLVRFPTVNPPGDEGPLAAHLAEQLRAMGLETELREVLPGRPNVVARLRGTAGRPVFLFNTHMHMVPPGAGWTRNPFAKNGGSWPAALIKFLATFC